MNTRSNLVFFLIYKMRGYLLVYFLKFGVDSYVRVENMLLTGTEKASAQLNRVYIVLMQFA